MSPGISIISRRLLKAILEILILSKKSLGEWQETFPGITPELFTVFCPDVLAGLIVVSHSPPGTTQSIP